MSRKKGTPNKMTAAIKDAVELSFSKKNKGGKYLDKLADDFPAVYCGLIAKCMPQAIAVDVQIHAINLGLEMKRAADTLALLTHPPDTPPLIDVTPDTVQPDTPSPVTVSGDADDV